MNELTGQPTALKSTADVVYLLRHAPESVITPRERQIIAAAMTTDTKTVKGLMTPKPELTLLYENDFLGPLMLDALYRTGLSHFPVLNNTGSVVGVLHTDALTSLEIKDTARAKDFLDPHIYYLREDYSVDQAFAAFLRTNCYFFIVIDKYAKLTGLLAIKDLLAYILGKIPRDDFSRDADLYAVARR